MSFFLMVSKDLSDCHWIQLRGQERLNATPEESKRCKGAQPFRGKKTRALEFNYRPFSYMTSIFLAQAHHQSSWNSSSRYWILNISTSQYSSKESIAKKNSKILVSGKFYNGSYNKLLCTSWVPICQTAVWANPRSSVRTDFGQDVYKQEDWLTRQLGNFKTVCEWQTQVSTEHWAVSTGHRVYNVYGLGIDLHAPRQSECWLTPARHLTPMFTNEHLHHQQHQHLRHHQHRQHHQQHQHLHPHLPSISCRRLSLDTTLLQAKSHNCKKLGPPIEILSSYPIYNPENLIYDAFVSI